MSHSRNTNEIVPDIALSSYKLQPTQLQHERSVDSASDELTPMSQSPPSNNSEDTPPAELDPSTLPDATTQITKAWDIPPRPKPGRKPAIDVPPTKRKAQNRDSQRKFRQKKVEEVLELRDTLRLKETETQQKFTEWVVEKQKLQHECQQWREHAGYWQHTANRNQATIADLETKLRELQDQRAVIEQGDRHRATVTSALPSVAHNGTIIGHNHVKEQFSQDNLKRSYSEKTVYPQELPNEEEMEIDFTTFGKQSSSTNQQEQSQQSHDYSIPSMALDTPLDGTCGFCDRGGLCLCSEVAHQINTLPAISAETESGVSGGLQRTQTMEPPTTATGPGTCDACLSDPERRRFCQSLASQVQLPPLRQIDQSQPKTTTSQIPDSNNQSEPVDLTSVRITCADTYERLKQFPRFREDSSRIIQELRPRPAVGDEPSGTLDGIGRAPLAVDAASLDAACMLAAMSEGMRIHPYQRNADDAKREQS